VSALPADPKPWRVAPLIDHYQLEDVLNSLAEDGYAVEDFLPAERPDPNGLVVPVVTVVALRADIGLGDDDDDN
jgi:hypothetical protein